jgi:hypothetical protein
MSSARPFTILKNCVYVAAVLSGRRPYTVGHVLPLGSVAIKMKSWTKGGGAVSKVPSTLIYGDLLNTSTASFDPKTIIIFFLSLSAGPKYLKWFL